MRCATRRCGCRQEGHASCGKIVDSSFVTKAIGAVAASILNAAYHMLKDGTLYQDLGANHFDSRDKGKQALRLVNRLQSLAFPVQITSTAA